jgi:hypothetical protein
MIGIFEESKSSQNRIKENGWVISHRTVTSIESKLTATGSGGVE